MSSSDVLIQAQGLGKCYHLYDKPHHRLLQTFFRGKRQCYREFWALQDISFTLHKGESLGILGRNGAGKSTLLQMLSGVLKPTIGSMQVNGRVAALLELGSGFNPEFTGRENAYLNGRILGLSQEELDEAMPEIERFAGVGNFFDQPVKLYSSGMVVRVAFAVQVQLKPDILIIDEALAVGDVYFQQKCYRRMQELIKSGVSLLIVSHDLASIGTFCQRALLLEYGKQLAIGSAKEISDLYLLNYKREAYANGTAEPITDCESAGLVFVVGDKGAHLSAIPQRIGTKDAHFHHVWFMDENKEKTLLEVPFNKKFYIKVRIEFFATIEKPILCYRIDSLKGLHLTGSTTLYDNIHVSPINKHQVVDAYIETRLPLHSGEYSLCLYINAENEDGTPTVLDGLETAAFFTVADTNDKAILYQYETERTWDFQGNASDPAQRILIPDAVGNDAQTCTVSILGQKFVLPQHWFWPQFTAHWETDTFLAFQRLISPESQVVDIGTWVGPCMLYALALGAKHVHCVEANRATYEYLQKVLEYNPAITERVSTFNACIAPAEGEYNFGMPDGNLVTSSAASLRGFGSTISGLPLYAFLEKHNLLDAHLIKIDIEGAECEQAKSLERLAQRGTSYIHLSLHPPFWGKAEQIQTFLHALSCFSIYDASWNPMPMEKLEAYVTSKAKYPPWGTIHGNFFEVVLKPKSTCSKEGDYGR